MDLKFLKQITADRLPQWSTVRGAAAAFGVIGISVSSGAVEAGFLAIIAFSALFSIFSDSPTFGSLEDLDLEGAKEALESLSKGEGNA